MEDAIIKPSRTAPQKHIKQPAQITPRDPKPKPPSQTERHPKHQREWRDWTDTDEEQL